MTPPDTAPNPPADPHPQPAPSRAAHWAVGLLATLLTAQVGLAWLHGRLLNRQHQQLLALQGDIQTLAEALEHAWVEEPMEEGALAPANRASRSARRPVLARHRQQPAPEPPPEQDPALKEIEAAKQSGEKAVKDAKVAQQKLSITHAAERAERAEKVDKASKGFFWASILTPVILIAAFAARGWIRRRRA
jgi:hypothetical protein